MQNQGPAVPPRTVLVVVVDQLGAGVFSRYLSHLPEDGLLRRAAEAGSYFEKVEFDHASTYTAPGHAAIFTGLPPAGSGVVANAVWNRDLSAVLPSMDDREHPVLRVEGRFAGPATLAAPTVADRLHEESDGAAKIVSLSLKDRGAMLGAGQHPDLVMWFEPSIPGFSTSTRYARSIPSWLPAFERRFLPDRMTAIWRAASPGLYRRVLGRDDAPGEGDVGGYGARFPHDPKATDAPHAVARAAPVSAEMLVQLGAHTAEHLELGADDIPDLLALSVSTPDYAGHIFGPDSWEYQDVLIRTDRALGALYEQLSRRGDVVAIITSDHGVGALPEREEGGGRIDLEEVVRRLDAELDTVLGRGDWVEAYVPPFIYLSSSVERRDRGAAARGRAATFVAGLPGIHSAYDVPSLVDEESSDDDPIRALARRSVRPDRDGDIFVVPARGWVVDETAPHGAGTSHGSPWDYDRQVPGLFFGPSVRRQSHREPVPIARLTATIAAFLGVSSPVEAEPLPVFSSE